MGISSSQANQQLLSSQVLLPFSISKTQAVCERALGRIWKLSGFMTSSFWQQVRRHENCVPVRKAAAQV